MIRSPITGSFNTSVILQIKVSDLVSLYNTDYQIDVSSYFEHLENIELVKCLDTGYRFFYPGNIYGDDKFYQWFQQFDFYYSKEKWEYDLTARLLCENDRVLEIGSGAGHLLRKLKAIKLSRLAGLELNSDMVLRSRKEDLDVVNETIEEFANKNAGAFDVVYSHQVLEHITEVKSFLDSALLALKPNGKLILCVPNNNPYLHIHELMHTLNLPPHHAGLWNKESFLKLPEYFPIKVEKIYIEPLVEYRHWYNVQLKQLKEKKHWLYYPLSILPRPVYKNFLKLMRHNITGRNIFVEYSKTN